MLKTNTKTLVLISVIAAMSTALMFFPQFPIFPGFGWLKFDFADVPALLAGVAISPVAGGIIVVLRGILHFILMPDGLLFSEIGNITVSFCLVVSAGLMSKYLFKDKLMKNKLLLVLPIASLFQIGAAILSNLFIMIPLYGKFVDFNAIGIDNYIFYGVIPFNLIKDAVSCIMFYLIYRYIFPLVRKQMY